MSKKFDELKSARYTSELSEFLEGDIDHEQLWRAFDTDRNGFLSHDEFKVLLNACLGLFSYVKIDEEDPHFEEKIPTQAQLAPKVDVLFSILLPQLDKNGDGVIDKSEFKQLGRYIQEEFQKQHERDNLPESSGAELKRVVSGAGLANMADLVFREIEEVLLDKYRETRGKIDYFEDQIMEYDSAGLTGVSFWTYLTGTVLASTGLWLKMFFLCCLAAGAAVFSHFCLVEEKLDLVQLSEFMGGIEAALAFFAGFYIENVVGRWWTIRSEGIGGVCKSITDISLLIAGVARGPQYELERIQTNLVRYGLLAHAMIYLTAQDRLNKEEQGEAFKELQKRGLVTEKEMDILLGLNRKFSAVWGWILSYLANLVELEILPEDRFEQLAEITREGRKSASLVLTHIECQLPLPYVHLICLMTNLYQVIFALVTGIIISAGLAQEMDQKIITQCLQFLLFTTVYQGILETVEKMANPLGTDDIDYPQLYIHMGLQHECNALFSAANATPWGGDRQATDSEAE